MLFCMRLGWGSKEWRLGKILLTKFLHWVFGEKKSPKMSLKWSFLSFVAISSIICFYFFIAWNYSSIKAWKCHKQLVLFFWLEIPLINCEFEICFFLLSYLSISSFKVKRVLGTWLNKKTFSYLYLYLCHVFMFYLFLSFWVNRNEKKLQTSESCF